MPQLCLVPDATTVSGALAQALHPDVLALAPLIEWRLDRYVDLTAQTLDVLAAYVPPSRWVVTCRTQAQGGGLPGHPALTAQRARALRTQACALGAAFVDVELHVLESEGGVAAQGVTRWVASHHDFSALPGRAALQAMATRARALGASALKVVGVPAHVAEHGMLAQWANTQTTLPVIAIALGEAGLWSRVLTGRFARPGPYVLARPDGAAGVAPGQPTLQEMAELYRAGAVSARTRVLGVVGAPIRQSRSPKLHARAIRAAGADAVYLPFLVQEPLAVFLQHLAEPLALCGLSVTAPHKEAALAAAAAASAQARALGAANTLWRAAGQGPFVATNTDAAACVDSLEAATSHSVRDEQVLVLGAGGMARAAAYALTERGARVLVFSRRGEAAQRLCHDFASVWGQQGPRAVVTAAALHGALETLWAVVHCTPVGMAHGPYAQDAVLDGEQLGRLRKEAWVMDTVYAPAVTPLLASAQSLGLRTLGGADLFARQGAAQARLFLAEA